MNREAKKKPLNQSRRMKEMMEQKPKKERGVMPPPSRGHKDERREKRQDTKRNLREHTSMDRNYIASELLLAAKEMTWAETGNRNSLIAKEMFNEHTRTAAVNVSKDMKELQAHLSQAGDIFARLLNKNNIEEVSEKIDRAKLQSIWNVVTRATQDVRGIKVNR